MAEAAPLLPNTSLADRAYRIRRNAVLMGEVQGQGYIAQALDIADVLAVAYFHAMRWRAEDGSTELLRERPSPPTSLSPPDRHEHRSQHPTERRER